MAFSCYSDLVFPPPNGSFRDLYTRTTSPVRPESGFAAKGYLRDLYTGTTSAVRIEVNRLAAEGNIRGISADGRFVLWTKDIPTNIVQPFSFRNTFNLYVRDMLKQEAKLVTISSDGKSDARNSDGNDVPIHDAAISADGRFVVFVTRATNLAPEKTTMDFEDIFVRDTVAQVTKIVRSNAWNTASCTRQACVP